MRAHCRGAMKTSRGSLFCASDIFLGPTRQRSSMQFVVWLTQAQVFLLGSVSVTKVLPSAWNSGVGWVTEWDAGSFCSYTTVPLSLARTDTE